MIEVIIKRERRPKLCVIAMCIVKIPCWRHFSSPDYCLMFAAGILTYIDHQSGIVRFSDNEFS